MKSLATLRDSRLGPRPRGAGRLRGQRAGCAKLGQCRGLLVRPGTLTRRYVLGQRVSFVSPITLFLFSVFLMFFTVTTIDPANSLTERMKLSAKDRAELRVDLDSARQDLAEAERDVKNDDSPAVAAQAVEAAKS